MPATDGQGPEAELAPVFAALAADVEACAELVGRARSQADKDIATARTRAAAIVSQARLDAGAARAETAARVSWEAGEQDGQVMARARDEADAVEKFGRARIPGVVDQVVDALFAPWKADAP
ncbi:MAG: hypothetical protein WBX27_12330 [Specibacter sp.]